MEGGGEESGGKEGKNEKVEGIGWKKRGREGKDIDKGRREEGRGRERGRRKKKRKVRGRGEEREGENKEYKVSLAFWQCQ